MGQLLGDDPSKISEMSAAPQIRIDESGIFKHNRTIALPVNRTLVNRCRARPPDLSEDRT